MGTEHIYICGCIRIRVRFRTSKTSLSATPPHPKVVFLLTIPRRFSVAVLLCASLMAYVAFVLSLFSLTFILYTYNITVYNVT